MIESNTRLEPRGTNGTLRIQSDLLLGAVFSVLETRIESESSHEQLEDAVRRREKDGWHRIERKWNYWSTGTGKNVFCQMVARIDPSREGIGRLGELVAGSRLAKK